VAPESDIAIRVPDDDTPCIQEVHLAVVHLLCDMIEGALAREPGRTAPGGR
jgi:hypothetical protein